MVKTLTDFLTEVSKMPVGAPIKFGFSVSKSYHSNHVDSITRLTQILDFINNNFHNVKFGPVDPDTGDTYVEFEML